MRHISMRVTVMLVTALIFLVTPAAAQRRGTDRLNLLMTQTVAAGTTSLRFEMAQAPGMVKALRVVARGGTAEIERIIVTYANGQVHYEDRERPIMLNAGERTAEIDPRETGRFVDQVDIKLVKPATTGMRLEIWALQDEAGRSMRRDQVGRVRSAPPTTYSNDRGVGPAQAPPVGQPRVGDDGQKRSAAPDTPKPYIELDVYYGTNRKPEADRKVGTRTLASFGTTPVQSLSLGRAVVTIPKEGREKGQVNRPEWDLIVASFALRGQDMSRDFTLLAVDPLSKSDFGPAARAQLGKAVNFKGHAIVFVHGYNVGFDDALFRAAQIAYDTDFDGLPLVFSWPSLGGVRGYFLDQRRARASGDALREFIDLVATETGAEHIHLIAHSMGANPILEGLQAYMTAPDRSNKPRFSEIILAAPDVLRDDFERLTRRIDGLAKRITLFASSNDRALQISNFTTLGVSPAGYVPPNAPPVVTTGVDTLDVSSLNTSVLGLNHSTFADRASLLSDIKAMIMDTGRRSPPERQPKYKPITVPAGGLYWRFEE